MLVGYDNDDELKAYKDNKDVTVIEAKPGQTMEDIAKQIKTPANIILQTHGSKEGTFQWNYGENIPYNKLFDALPRRGVESIMLGGCYGGSAEREAILKSAPPGTLVQSMTGADTVNSGEVSLQFAREIKGVTKPVDFFIKALDNFDPDAYHNVVEFYKKMPGYKGMHLSSDPALAMPHIVGLGGVPPKAIDLDNEMQQFTSTRLNQDAYKKAITRVESHFDTVSMRMAFDKNGQYTGEEAKGLGEEGEKNLRVKIEQVAEKMKHENPTFDINERRIAYALSAAYLDESGILKERILEVQAKTISNLGISEMPLMNEQIARQLALKPVTEPPVPALKAVAKSNFATQHAVPDLHENTAEPAGIKHVQIAGVVVAPAPTTTPNKAVAIAVDLGYHHTNAPTQALGAAAAAPAVAQNNTDLKGLQNHPGVQAAIANLASSGTRVADTHTLQAANSTPVLPTQGAGQQR